MQRESFVFYQSFFEASKSLSDEDRLKYYDRIIGYGIAGIDEKKEGICETLFVLIKPLLDSNNKKFETGKDQGHHGKKGGRPTKNPKDKKTKTPVGLINKTPNVDVEEDVNVNDNVEYITSKEEMNDFVFSLPDDEQERIKSKRLALLCLLDSKQRYPIHKNVKFLRDWVEWLTETCTRYGYVDEFGKVTRDMIGSKFIVMKQWLIDNKQGQIVSLKRTVHTFLDPERQKGKPNK